MLPSACTREQCAQLPAPHKTQKIQSLSKSAFKEVEKKKKNVILTFTVAKVRLCSYPWVYL